jgi:hypothetical protein
MSNPDPSLGDLTAWFDGLESLRQDRWILANLVQEKFTFAGLKATPVKHIEQIAELVCTQNNGKLDLAALGNFTAAVLKLLGSGATPASVQATAQESAHFFYILLTNVQSASGNTCSTKS